MKFEQDSSPRKMRGHFHLKGNSTVARVLAQRLKYHRQKTRRSRHRPRRPPQQRAHPHWFFNHESNDCGVAE